MGIIYPVSILCLLLSFYVGRKHPAYALSILVPFLLLVPNCVKFNVGINMNVYNLSVLVLFVCSLKYIRRKHPIDKSLVHTFIFFSVYVFFTTGLVYEPESGISEYIQNMILFGLEYVFIAVALLNIRIDDQGVKYFNCGILIASAIIILYGIINYITKLNIYIMLLSDMTEGQDAANQFMEESRGIIQGRISSTFLHPLQLGQASLLLFTYTFYQMREWLNKIVWVIVLIGLFVMVVLCGSRSAIFPVLMVLVFYLRFLNIKKVMTMGIVGLCALIVVYNNLPVDAQLTIDGMVKVWDDKAADKAGIKGSSKDMRSDQISSAFAIVSSNPLLGKGEGYVRLYGEDHPEMRGYEGVHLRSIVDWGILGTLFFFALFYKMHRRLLVHCRTKIEKAQAYSLTLPFFVSAFLTGISYSFFGLFVIFYCVTYNAILNRRSLYLFMPKHEVQ